MKKIIKYFKDIWLQIADALVTVASPLSEWVELATTVNVLRRQFSAVTASKYADAIAPVIKRLSSGDLELERDLWTVAIGLAARRVDAVDILLEFDNAAYRDDGSVVDLLLYRTL